MLQRTLEAAASYPALPAPVRRMTMNALGTYMHQRWTVFCSDCGVVAFSWKHGKEEAVEDLHAKGWREAPVRTRHFVGISAVCPECAKVHQWGKPAHTAPELASASSGDNDASVTGSVPHLP